MTTKTETKPQAGNGLTPVSHIVDKRVTWEKALCGADLMGIPNPDPNWPVCDECVEIFKQEVQA